MNSGPMRYVINILKFYSILYSTQVIWCFHPLVKCFNIDTLWRKTLIKNDFAILFQPINLYLFNVYLYALSLYLCYMIDYNIFLKGSLRKIGKILRTFELFFLYVTKTLSVSEWVFFFLHFWGKFYKIVVN